MGGLPHSEEPKMKETKTLDTKLQIKAVYNPELKVIHYDMNNSDGTFKHALNKMLKYIESTAKSREEVTRLYSKTEPILDSQKIKGFLLEKFGGYKRI